MALTAHTTRFDRVANALGLRTPVSQAVAAGQCQSDGEAPSPSSPLGSFRTVTNHLGSRWPHRDAATMTMYRVSDRLHQGRTAQVRGHEIASTVSAWLAELGAYSPLVEDLARAACVGDWAAAYAVGDQLSVDVTVAAAA